MNVIDIYKAVSFRINKSQNGELTYADFNLISKSAELNFIDWLTGSFTGQEPPEMYSVQKVRDWLSFLITPYKAQVTEGIITRPQDYYQFENISRITGAAKQECEDEEEEDKPEDTSGLTITLLSNDKFNQRCQTFIKALKPSFKKAITKQVGVTFEFAPTDIGGVKLEYIRYPVFAEIKTTHDNTYNEDVADPLTSINYEWGDFARKAIIWFCVDEFFNHTREKAGKEFNAATAKTPRG